MLNQIQFTMKSKSWGSCGHKFLLTRFAIRVMLAGFGRLAGGACMSVAANTASTILGADCVKMFWAAFFFT